MFENILNKIYYNTKNNASFSSPIRLYEEAKLSVPNITLEDVKQWLSSQLTYTLHKQVRKNFKRNKIIVNRINDQFEADLVDMKEFSRQNRGYNYILTVIDCFSNYAFAIPIKTKSSINIVESFKVIFKTRKCSKLRTDRGKEFINDVFQKFLKQNDVFYFHSNDQKIKCAIVERFNRTLKNRMFKYFTSKGTRKYIDVLKDFITAYNSAYHRTIKMRPIDVTKENSDKVFENIYKSKNILDSLDKNKESKSKIKEGDTVRKAYDLKVFDRGFYPYWTDEIYKVEKDIKGGNKIVFRLKDYSGNTIEQRFYPEELQKITENLHRVEKVIKTRVIRGKKECFVKWLNYPERYNSWIQHSELRRL